MKPLAERLKPKTPEEVLGQEHLLGKNGALLPILKSSLLFSFILWGPPGTGKTSIALVIKNSINAQFFSISAVDSSLKDLKDIVNKAKKLKLTGKPTILFIDEIHRFNKSQQAFLLPFVEKGDIILIGATTENPSFEIIAPLLSRVKVFPVYPLSEEDIKALLLKAIQSDERLKAMELEFEEGVISAIARSSGGDARVALNTLELIAEHFKSQGKNRVILEEVPENLLRGYLRYDKSGEEHYNLISAFHKSMRGSDPDATIYWMARMLSAGEDPLYIARRIITCAAEDVGLADPMALVIAVSAKQAYESLGSPEGEIALAEAAIYVASAPKSNSAYKALKLALKEVEETKALEVPLHLRNPVTKLVKSLGYGKGYKYAHDYEEGFVIQQFLPDKIKNKIFYKPKDLGIEKKIKDRLKKLWKDLKDYS